MWKKLRNKLGKYAINNFIREAKWVMAYTVRYWKAVTYYIVLGIFGSVTGLASTLVSKELIDTVTGQQQGRLPRIIVMIVALTIGGIISKMVTKWIDIRIGLKVNREIQQDIYNKIMNTDWEALTAFHSGDVLNRFTGDVSIVSGSVLDWIPSLVIQLFEFIGTFAIIIYYDATMAVIALMSAPVTLLLSRFMTIRMRRFNKKMRIIYSEKMEFEQESFYNMQQIKAFDLVGLFNQRFSQIQQKYINATLEYNWVSIWVSAFLSLIGNVVSYSCFGWGVYRLWGGAITYGTMTMFLELSSSLSSGFSCIVSMVPSAIEVTTAAGRIMEIVELPKEATTTDADVIQHKNMKGGLKVVLDEISFHYNTGDEVLKKASLTASPQEIIALVGPSGEGKTTTVRMLLGLIAPQKGDCYLAGEGIGRIKISSSTRKFFSYVPQGNTLFSGTIAENMRMVRSDASDAEIIEALEAACAYEFVSRLPDGIHTKIIENGNGFSEGQYQRLCIARAILHEAPILLLDEATSALDVATERKVLRNILKLDRMRTCIITTHRPSVLSMCNRVYQIHKTKVEEMGHREIEELIKDF